VFQKARAKNLPGLSRTLSFNSQEFSRPNKTFQVLESLAKKNSTTSKDFAGSMGTLGLRKKCTMYCK